jgi:hypothetical protein
MLWWLLGVALLVLIWGFTWRTNTKLAFGVLLGLPLAWIFSRFITPYVTGMEEIPAWLPPLPLAIVAVTLFVFGVVVWLKADKLTPPKRDDDSDHAAH